jgi:O-acetyl-ADP-ribose deacetylase (regulator of RNase III)
MKIEYKTGDLLAGPERFICHGCNAQGVMRSGIAALIRDIYPNAYTTYRAHYDEHGLALGHTIFVECKPTDSRYRARTVIDAITQEHYGRDPNRVYVSYEAIEKAIKKIDDEARLRQETPSRARSHGLIESVGFPLIGAGLANGSWKIISSIIEEHSTDFQPVVYLFDGVMPTT